MWMGHSGYETRAALTSWQRPFPRTPCAVNAPTRTMKGRPALVLGALSFLDSKFEFEDGIGRCEPLGLPERVGLNGRGRSPSEATLAGPCRSALGPCDYPLH